MQRRRHTAHKARAAEKRRHRRCRLDSSARRWRRGWRDWQGGRYGNNRAELAHLRCSQLHQPRAYGVKYVHHVFLRHAPRLLEPAEFLLRRKALLAPRQTAKSAQPPNCCRNFQKQIARRAIHRSIGCARALRSSQLRRGGECWVLVCFSQRPFQLRESAGFNDACSREFLKTSEK